MAARSWDVEGVEISQSPRRITDFRVYGQEFQDIPVNEPVYDAVTAWAVLEHVHDPMSYFRRAWGELKKGGCFVFRGPNFRSGAPRSLFCGDFAADFFFLPRKRV